MDSGSPEKFGFVTSTATDIAIRLLQVQSDINDNDPLPQYNAQLIDNFERRNTRSEKAHGDMAPSSIPDNRRAETSYSLPDDRRAETRKQLRLYEPNCGYNDLHHQPRHFQKPKLSSAMTHIFSENNEQPTNRQDVFTETSIFTTSNSSPIQQIAQSKQQGCKAHRLHLLFRNPIN